MTAPVLLTATVRSVLPAAVPAPVLVAADPRVLPSSVPVLAPAPLTQP